MNEKTTGKSTYPTLGLGEEVARMLSIKDICVSCGTYIPEGSMVCPHCMMGRYPTNGKLKPIVLNTSAIHAIFEGRKTTIRLPKDPKAEELGPYQVGDILAVKETWRHDRKHGFMYLADIEDEDAYTWRSASLMPIEAVRLWLLVTDKKEEWLQDITEDGAAAEGYKEIVFGFTRPGTMRFPSRLQFRECWDMKYKRLGFGWYTNPRVWVYGIKRISKQ